MTWFAFPVWEAEQHFVQDQASCRGGARWPVLERSLQLKGAKKHVRLTPTRHPAINLLEFEAGSEGPQFWKNQDIMKTLDVLKDSPQTWAFVSGEGMDDLEEEDSGSSDQGAEMSESDDGE